MVDKMTKKYCERCGFNPPICKHFNNQRSANQPCTNPTPQKQEFSRCGQTPKASADFSSEETTPNVGDDDCARGIGKCKHCNDYCYGACDAEMTDPEDKRSANVGCTNCEGSGSVQTSCPDNKKGCLVYHAKPCPVCSENVGEGMLHHKQLEDMRRAFDNVGEGTKGGWIAKRIEAEHRKHSQTQDWARIAECKILGEFYEAVKELKEKYLKLGSRVFNGKSDQDVLDTIDKIFEKYLMSKLNEVKKDAKDI